MIQREDLCVQSPRKGLGESGAREEKEKEIPRQTRKSLIYGKSLTIQSGRMVFSVAGSWTIKLGHFHKQQSAKFRQQT